MAIIFEEKSNLGKNIAISLVILALLGAAIFWLLNLMQTNQPEIPDTPIMPAEIDVQVLQSSDLASLEIFPEITPAEIDFTNRNPFVEYVPAENEEESADEE